MTAVGTHRDLTASELRAAAARAKAARAACRMLALALVLDGVDRTTAAQTCGMDRRTLRGEEDQQAVRGTVRPANGHRCNAEGLGGLVNRRAPARPRQRAPGRMAELAAWVEAGPDPERDGVVRWRRRDLRARIESAFGVDMHERTVGKYLAALGRRRLSVRPRHPKADPAAQEALKNASPRR